MRPNTPIGRKETAVIALARDNGALVWSSPMTPSEKIASSHGLIFVKGTQPSVLDAATGKVLRTLKCAMPDEVTAFGDSVFYTSKYFALTREEARTGETVWEYPFEPGRSAVACDGTIVAMYSPSGVQAIDFATGKLSWSLPLAMTSDFSPVIVGDVVYAMDSGHPLFALDRKNGKELWRIDDFGPNASDPERARYLTACGDRLLVMTDNGVVALG